jgi:DUF1680 family protein
VQVNGESVDIEANLVKGYLALDRTWQDGDTVEVELPMPVERVRGHHKVRETAGRIALQRGPVVYCLEEVDNGPDLTALVLAEDPQFELVDEAELRVPAILARAYREESQGESLYTVEEPRRVPVQIKAIPYFSWDNRKPGEMLVWIRA